MAVQLFILRGVPDDEADEIRQLLTAHAIDYYETPAGNWGISMPALWLNNEYQLERAQALLDDYQQQRLNRARAEYAQQQRDGNRRTLLDEIKRHPVRIVAYCAVSVAILYFSIKPFLDLGQ